MTVSRVSDLRIEDDITRVDLYQKIFDYLNDNANRDLLVAYEVKADELTRADLTSQRIFGTVELQWLVLLVCGIDDELDGLPVGYTILLPSMAVVRRFVRSIVDAS